MGPHMYQVTLRPFTGMNSERLWFMELLTLRPVRKLEGVLRGAFQKLVGVDILNLDIMFIISWVRDI